MTPQDPAPPVDDRLERALSGLVTAGRLEEGQADAVREAYRTESAGAPAHQPVQGAPGAGRIPEVLGYLGGAFVVAAVLLVLGWSWDDFDYSTRLLFAVIGAVVTFGGGLLLAGSAGGGFGGLRKRSESPRRRLVGVLLVAGTWISVGAVGLVADHENVRHQSVWVVPVALVLGLVVVRVAPGVLPTWSLFVASVATVFAVQDATPDVVELVWVLVFLALGVAWVLLGPPLTRAGSTALVLGLATLVVTAWVAAAHDLAESYGGIAPPVEAGERAIAPLGVVSLVVLTVLGCVLYLRGGAWPWMAAGTVAAVALVVQLTGDEFGPAVAALVAGMVLLAASGILVLRRGRAERRASAPPDPVGSVSDPGP